MAEGGGQRVLLVGVWGLPASWRRVVYKPVLPPEPSGRWRAWRPDEWAEYGGWVESHSTIVAEAWALHSGGFEVSLLVFVADSLASPGGEDKTGCPDAKEISQGVKSASVGEPPESYKALVGRAGKLGEAYLECFLGEVFGEEAPGARLVVVPSSAAYRVRDDNRSISYYYRSEPSTARALMEYALLEALDNLRPDLVILDTSHGVNYFPLLAREALSRAVRVYAALRGGRVYYSVVNSDPVQAEGEESRIHVIEAGMVELGPLEALVEFYAGHARADRIRVFRSLTGGKPPVQALKLNKAAEEFRQRYAPLVGSLRLSYHYGFPLYIAAKLNGLDVEEARRWNTEYERLLAEALGAGRDPYQPRIKVDRDKGQVVVEWDYTLLPPALDTLYATRLLEKLAGESRGLLEAEAVEGITFYPLSRLQEMAEKFGVSIVGLTMLKSELNDIRGKVESFEAKCGRLAKPAAYDSLLSALEGGCNDAYTVSECRESIVNRRNFYAHAGMERHTILVARRGGDVQVAYRPECVGVVEKLLAEGG